MNNEFNTGELDSLDVAEKYLSNALSSDTKKSEIDIRFVLKSINRFVEDFEKKSDLNQKSFAKVNKIIYQLSMAMDKNSENAKIKNDLSRSLMRILKIFSATSETLPFHHASTVFVTMLKNVLTDAREEIVGQEKPSEAMMVLIEDLFRRESGMDDETMNKIKKLASSLYPVVLLSAQFDSNVQIPPKNHEAEEVKRDGKQFEKDYKHQFKNLTYQDVWSSDRFGESLRIIWNYQREERNIKKTLNQ